MKLQQYIDISSQQHCVQILVMHGTVPAGQCVESINRLLSLINIKILPINIIYYFIFIHYECMTDNLTFI